MMKRKGKVLSLVLAAILTVSSGSVVQAADTSAKVQNTHAVKAEAQSLEAQSSIVKAVKAAKVSPVSAQSATVKATKTTVVDGSIPVIMMNTGNESQQSRSDYTCGPEWNSRQSLSVQSGCNIQNERYIGFRNELFGKIRQCKAEISYLRIVL